MADKPSVTDRMIDAALTLAAEQGFRSTGIAEIAAAAGVTAAEAYRVAPDKATLIARYIERVDTRALDAAYADGPPETPRDRLFDATMRRFEMMASDREALRVILHDLRRDPVLLFALRGPVYRSIGFLIEEAGLEREGVLGAIRVRALALLLAQTFRVFLDDGADLSKTMADLDRRLRRNEGRIRRAERPPARAAARPDAAPEAQGA